MIRTGYIGIIGLLLILPRPLSADNPSTRIESVQCEYVQLRDWARVNDFETRWLKPDVVLQLGNRAHKLVFIANSREAELDGIKIWLSFPIAFRGGSGYVAAFDLQSTIQPLLFPPKSFGAKIKTIALDPGHGGKDAGNINGGNKEKKYTLLLAQELREQLVRAGFKVFLTRTTDSFIEKEERPVIANKRGADLFVSLHLNSWSGSKDEVRGVETYCFTPAGASSSNSGGKGTEARPSRGNRNDEKNVLLAYQLQKSLVKNLSAEDRGVKRARYAVLRDSQMPAVLIEAGFLSHPGEGRKLVDPAYRRQIAKAIVNGVQSYQRMVEEKQ